MMLTPYTYQLPEIITAVNLQMVALYGTPATLSSKLSYAFLKTSKDFIK